MTDTIDEELQAGLLRVPEGFADRVMAEIAAQPLPARPPTRTSIRDLVEWLAVAGAVLAGASQLAGFLFGIWTFTAAG
ncbi:MAG TPA: hypothetical protein VE175_09880 [Woeseiaceae bacterium]|nr:hypothetical protein [Woeseiaceae bacterium]